MLPETETETVFRFLPQTENIVFSRGTLMCFAENFEFSNQLIHNLNYYFLLFCFYFNKLQQHNTTIIKSYEMSNNGVDVPIEYSATVVKYWQFYCAVLSYK